VATIVLERVRKVFDGGHVAVDDVSVEIRDGELVVLVGPSGSGKSTLLRLIAGLEQPTGGRILIGDRDVTAVPPQARDLAMVFQSYALYPHKSVRDNLSFGLRMRGVPRADIDARVSRVASVLQIDALLERKPSQLSGGQRQRVALGRAIVREPRAFLFDEPLSNLDPALRLETRTELALLHRRLGATMVYVTHDQEEAMKLGQRLVLLRDGRVEQVGPPLEIYQRPATLFAARFLGSPPMNVLDAVVGDDGRSVRIDGAHAPLPLPESLRSFASGQRVAAAIRPHDVDLVAPDEGDVQGTVAVVEPAGSELHVHVRTNVASAPRLIVATPPDRAVSIDTPAGVRFRRDRLHVFPAADLNS
jgi:multiple sugar transport system ATP-binding protein